MKTSLQRQREYQILANEEEYKRTSMREKFISDLSQEAMKAIRKKFTCFPLEKEITKNNLVIVDYKKWPQIKISIYDMDKSEPNRCRDNNDVIVMQNSVLYGLHQVWGKIEIAPYSAIRRCSLEVFKEAPLDEKSPRLWPKSAIVGKPFRVTLKTSRFNLDEINEIFEDFIEATQHALPC